MPRAADPKKVTDIASVGLAFKRKAINVSLNLDTAIYEVKNAKGEVIKTFPVAKGYDAVYVINRSAAAGDITAGGEHLKSLQARATREAADIEAAFAETQDQLMRAVNNWKAAEPGTARSEIALEIGRLQQEMATQEARLRKTQYKYRGVNDVIPAPRRLYEPLSFDDRSLPHPVYALTQYETRLADRVIPVRSMETA